MNSPKMTSMEPDLSSAPLALNYLVAYGVVLLTLGIIYFQRDRRPSLPQLNPRKPLELTNSKRLGRFMQNSLDILIKGRTQYRHQPYKLLCDWGRLIALPEETVDDIRSDRRFDFSLSASDVWSF